MTDNSRRHKKGKGFPKKQTRTTPQHSQNGNNAIVNLQLEIPKQSKSNRPTKQTSNWILLIITALISGTGGFFLQKIFSGPKVSINLLGFQQHTPRIQDKNSRSLFLIPITIYNTGDKKYFLENVSLEIRVDEKWLKLRQSFADSLDDYENGTKIKLGFISMVNLDTLKSIPADDAISGRFVFETDSGILDLNNSEPYDCRFIFTDRNGNNLTFLKNISPVVRYKPGVFYPRMGIRTFEDTTK